jgi:hypothetical protein
MTTLTLENLRQATELLGVSKEDLLKLLIDQKRYDEAIECFETVKEAKFVYDYLDENELSEEGQEVQIDNIFKVWQNLSLQAVASFDEKTPKDELYKLLEFSPHSGNARKILLRLKLIADKKESISRHRASIRLDIAEIRRNRIELAKIREEIKK